MELFFFESIGQWGHSITKSFSPCKRKRPRFAARDPSLSGRRQQWAFNKSSGMNGWEAAWMEAGRGDAKNFRRLRSPQWRPVRGGRNRGDWENPGPLGAPRQAQRGGRWLGKTGAPSPRIPAERSRASACASAFISDPGRPHAGGPGRSALRSHEPTRDRRPLT